MSRYALALLLLLSLAGSSSAGENSWLFRRSYYSHEPARPVTIAKRNIAGTPQFTQPQGAYFKSGFRVSRNTINVRGWTVDNYYEYDGWTQTGSQY